jgi:hypothetical protein
MAGKTCLWEAIELAAEKIQENENADYYASTVNLAVEAQNYFEEQRAKMINIYSRKFN